jgi:uncharacterized membrane protein
MVIRIGSIIVSIAGLLALLLGLVLWFGGASTLVQMHMLLGILTVAALWVIGIAQAFSPGGSWVTAGLAVLIGAIVLWLGMIQTSLMTGNTHWVIQVLHLVLGVAAIGVGHMAAARSRKPAL